MKTESTRHAIVTGAARGIGLAVARRLAEGGMTVACADLNADGVREAAQHIRNDGGRAIPVVLDVTDSESVAQAVDQFSKESGPPTVLVNNAGVIRDNLLRKMSEDDWESVMAVHLRGAFLMSRAVQGFMVEAGWGRVVNLSSVSALGNRGQANYAAAKAGLQGFTKSLAIELGKHGVTVNAVAPGFIDTEMTRQTAERVRVPYEDFKAAAASKIPVGRVGRPEDVAAAVAFFAGEHAGFVSGQVLYVAGGPRC